MPVVLRSSLIPRYNLSGGAPTPLLGNPIKLSSGPMVLLNMLMFLVSTSAGRSQQFTIDKEDRVYRSLRSRAPVDQPGGEDFDYDLFVIGGGSGGLAASKLAASMGQKVAVADFVKPSPAGTSWGLGGTCVNVGCIPKKLFHAASLTAESSGDAIGLGYDQGKLQHDWGTMVKNVDLYIKSLNWKYRTELRSKQVTYLNAFATFVDPHTLALVDGKGVLTKVRARHIIIACGGRPSYGDYPGAKEYAISSDDIFWRTTPPGKTLVVGASYIALECAGFLTGLGFDTTVMVRSVLLRGFDEDMAKGIGSYMEKHGTKFAHRTVPTRFEKDQSTGKVMVYALTDGSEEEVLFGSFDTVIMAIGRTALAGELNLEAAGVKYNHKSGKISVDEYERTTVSHIFAIGDVTDRGKLELTPVAIAAGRLLVQRLFNGSTKLMDYSNVPTTVFTPLEYGAVGLSEVEARQRYAGVKVYHTYFKPLEWALNPERGDAECYIKVIVDVFDEERVVGVHVLGPSAGEMIQGIAIAMKAKCTKQHLDDTIGIHPTNAESFCGIEDVKEEGQQLEAKGGC